MSLNSVASFKVSFRFSEPISFVCLNAVPGRVRVAVRLRPSNAEELVADADSGDCVELQPEVSARN